MNDMYYNQSFEVRSWHEGFFITVSEEKKVRAWHRRMRRSERRLSGKKYLF